MLHSKKFLLVLLFLLGTSFCAFATDLGNHKIPERVTYAGTAIEPGMYMIQIVDGAEGPYLQLSKGSDVVAKDLAIVIPARGSGRNSVQIANIAGQEFLRIRVRSGENWYYAYLVRSH